MDRLTNIRMICENGPNLYDIHIDKNCELSEAIRRVIERLGQYEDTGLSPSQIQLLYKTGAYWKKISETEYKCSSCNTINKEASPFCPHCGHEMNAPIFYQENDTSLSKCITQTINDEPSTIKLAVDESGNPIPYAIDIGDTVFEVPSNWKVHASHCCIMHGCKYGDDDCPVVLAQVRQKYSCYDCKDDSASTFLSRGLEYHNRRKEKWGR